MEEQGRLPPHDIEAEEALVGSLLIDPDAILKVVTFLKADDFFDEVNAAVYGACVSLCGRSEPINQISVAHELMRLGQLEQCGGASNLNHLIGSVPTSLHAEFYGRIVERMSLMRKLIVAGRRIASVGYEAGPDVDESLRQAEDALFQVRMREGTRDFVSIRDVLEGYFEKAGSTDEDDSKGLPQVKTGFTGLDGLLGGLQRSDLIILAARPSIGKTTLALDIARRAAVDQKACVALFSLEMAAESVVQRMLAAQSDVDFWQVRLGKFLEHEERKIMKAAGTLSDTGIYIDDTPQVGTMSVTSKAKRLDFERRLDLIIIDYLQLIQGDGRKETRVQELSQITRALKLLARELNVPVIAVSQLSRAVEWRTSHEPILADLRESGTIEQDADIVLFIYREDKYVGEEEWNRLHDIMGEPYPKGIADVIVAKHRNGPLGRVKMRFVDRVVRFDNLEQGATSSSFV
ncbi:MAG: replicative DNA helicase [Dehalococcoidia bacterium]|nr:MAG: replicative DNA helicase [Dehalococcoidia bacterium]